MIKVNIPIVVVNIPVLFDFVQPDNTIKRDREIIPNIKVPNPRFLGKFKSPLSIARG